MTTIVIDGLSEEDFRRSIQNRLREGKLAPAIARLRRLLTPFTGAGGLLPERFLTVSATELALTGWESLGTAISRHDRADRPVGAVSIAFGWAGEEVPQPDVNGHLKPHLETSYFNDDSFPFSLSSREDLLEGYSYDGCTWSGDPVATDTAIGLDGIDDLYGALAALEARLLATDEPDEAGLCAGSLGACLLSALLIEAVTWKILHDGLPRPLCITAGSSGVYPYFDAPVAGMSAETIKVNVAKEDMIVAAQGVPVPRYSSLLVTSIPRAKKRAVLVLEESDDELAVRLDGLRNLHHAEPGAIEHEHQPVPVEPAIAEPVPVMAEGGLLLAKKPPKVTSDFRDMLTPRDGDLQQRLQSLLATHTPPAPEILREPTPVADAAPMPDRSAEPEWLGADHSPEIEIDMTIDDYYEMPGPTRRARVWAKLKSWFGKLAPRRFD